MPFEMPAYDPTQSRRIVIMIALICFMFAAVWAYIFYHQQPRVADGAIEAITAIPLHTELREGGTMREGSGGSVQKSDEMLVWVAFTMKNLTPAIPLFETRQRATLSMPDGQQMFAMAENPSEVAKVRAYPKLQQMSSSPVSHSLMTGALVPLEMTLAPQQSTEGLALFAFPVTQQVWDTRREFSVDVSFQYQRDLAMKEKVAAP